MYLYFYVFVFVLLCILYVFVVFYLSVLESMAAEFVLGVIQAIDSEKDPRNLLVTLQIVSSIAHQLPLGQLHSPAQI